MGHIKKIGLALTCVALSFILSMANIRIGMASPATTVYVDPPIIGLSPFYDIDDEITIYVSISEGFDVKTTGFQLSWNGPILECLSVVKGDFLIAEGTTFFTKTIWNNPDPVGRSGYINVGESLMGIGGGASGYGTLAVVTFRVEAVGQSGLHLYEVIVLDSLGQLVTELVVEDGNFDNEGWLARGEPGDVDGDHDVDIEDLMIIARAMGTTPAWPHGTDWYEWNPVADLNGDERVDVEDLVISATNFGQPWIY